MSLSIDVHDGLADDGLVAEWDALVAADPDATVFHTARYLRVWEQVLGEGSGSRVLAVRRDGELVGIVPEAHSRIGSPTGPRELRQFLGGDEVTDYLGPVGRPGDRDDVVAAYLDHLREDRDWDELVAGGLGEGVGWAEAFRSRGRALDDVDVVDDVTEDVCPRVDLSGGYDAYLSRLPGKLRHEQKRKLRKLARDAGELEMVRATSSDVHAHLDTFFEMAAGSESPKARFFKREEMRDFFRALADELVDDGTFRVHVLEVGGLAAAATVSLVWDGEWGLYNSAFDPALGSLAPGMVQVAMLIEEAAVEGFEVFDLLRGDEPYKYRFGAEDRPITRLTLSRS